MGPGSRERARVLLVKALYQWQIAGHELDELKAQFGQMAEFRRVDQAYFEDLLARAIAEAGRFDAEIARLAARGIDQLDAVAHGVLLLAMAELAHREDVPVKVVINEAVKLTKRFGAQDSFRFVNAVLEKASKSLRPATEVSAG
jgi:N utilization substance protein B